MISIIFTNGTQSVNLKYVRSVEWSADFDKDVLVDPDTRIGKRTRKIVINGFVNKPQFTNNVLAQQQVESDLMAVGVGTIKYGDADHIENARFTNLEFKEFRGNPICEYSATFETEENNVHAHHPIKVDTLSLVPSNGFEYASVKETLSSQGPDEQINRLRRRLFVIEGSFVGSTLTDINASQLDFENEIKEKTSFTLTLTTGAYTVRPKKFEVGSPRIKESGKSRSFTFECETYDDYTKEPYTLGETAASYAGISLDVVESVDHNTTFERTTSVWRMLTEELIVSGKKYFTDWDDYVTFRDLFRPIETNTYFFSSASSNTLELADVSVAKLDRDNNFEDTTKRYSAQVSLTFRWVKQLEKQNYSVNTTYFGISFYKVGNISFNSSVDSFGNVTSRSVSFSGEVIGLSVLNSLKALVGTQVTFDSTYSNLYITSVSVNGTDAVNNAGTEEIVYKVSINASQLDSASQAISFIRGLFKMERVGATGTVYSTDTIQFENITNLSKSISNRWDSQNLRFKVTSITISISGEVFDPDNGSGKPTSPNKLIDLFNKIDALLRADGNSLGSDPPANTIVSGEIMPTNVSFMLNSFNLGQWQPAVAPENLQGSNGSKGARYWRQTVSVSATAVFDLTGSTNSQPDSIESKSISIDKESPKYTQLQVLGFGTVFKRVGTNPERATVTYQKQFRSASLYVADDYGADDVDPPSNLVNKSVITKESRENRGLVNRHIVEYTANQKVGT